MKETFEFIEKLAPYHISWKKDLSVNSIGKSLRKLWMFADEPCESIAEGLLLVRPFPGSFNASWLSELTNMSLYVGHKNAPERTLRGQILDYKDSWFLIATPNISSTNQLNEFDLELNDLPFQDVAGDLLIANEANIISLRESQAHAVELQTTLDKLHSVNKILSGFVPPEIMQTLNIPEEASDLGTYQAEAVGRFIEQLQETLDFRQSFLANMSHELRTPLNAVLGITEIIAEGLYGDVTEKQKEMLQTVHKSGQDLLDLINDILDLNKIITGQVELEKVPLSISDVCQSVFTYQKVHAEKKGLNISLHLENDLPVIVADEKKIRSALQKLVENAIKFSTEGDVTIRAFLKSDGTRLAIEIADTGVGISPEQQEQIFQPFVQLDRGYNRKHEGTGLGLAIAVRAAELHGGKIELASTLGKGSVFTVLLPLQNAETSTQTPTQLKAVRTSSKPPAPLSDLGNRVLIVDDTEINRRYVRDYLDSQGLEVSECASALDALSIVNESLPNLLLVDIHMPSMSGLDLIRCLRAMPRTKDLPIVVFSASMTEQDQDLCISAGANEFLEKPCSLALLSERIHFYIRNHSS